VRQHPLWKDETFGGLIVHLLASDCPARPTSKLIHAPAAMTAANTVLMVATVATVTAVVKLLQLLPQLLLV